jgi:uncharacterized protein YndB with AHSA1/START domain
MTTQKIQIAVKATPDQLWDALTNGKITPGYYIGGFEADFDLQPGKPYRYTVGGHETITGTVTEVEPGRRLVTPSSRTGTSRWRSCPNPRSPTRSSTRRCSSPASPT